MKRFLGILKRWQGEPEAQEGDASDSSEWGALVPQLLGAALLSAALVLVVMRTTGFGTPPVVVFDIIKYANAQRAVASKFITGKGAEEAAPLLLEVSRRTREVIAEVAGPGTLVVIRQSVVQGEMRDITDEVLTRLGLPTDVPTADPTRHVLDIAPTLLGVGPKIVIEDSTQSQPSTSRMLP